MEIMFGESSRGGLQQYPVLLRPMVAALSIFQGERATFTRIVSDGSYSPSPCDEDAGRSVFAESRVQCKRSWALVKAWGLMRRHLWE
jgi:hypothetical protein